MSKLFDFAFTDRRYRFTTYFVSGLIALISALISHLSLPSDERSVILVMVIVFCSIAAIFILYYVFAGNASVPDMTVPARPYLHHAVPIFAVVAVGFFSLSANTRIVSQVQAFIVDLRFVSVLRPPAMEAFRIQSSEQAQAQLRMRFQKLQSIADISYRYEIPVDPNSLLKAQTMIQRSLKQPALSEETRQAGLIASAKLTGVGALGKVETNSKELPSYPINSTVEISNQNIRFQGNHSRISGFGQFLISHSTVVFDGIDFVAEKPFGESFFFLDSDSTVVVRSSTIENIDQPLDGITWINVQFQHSMIRVNGGPFALVNVSFNDCDLRWLAFNPPASELLERITKANAQPISFAFEGSVKRTDKPE
jgi:hypothetical protein